jgi:hypothetical protein
MPSLPALAAAGAVAGLYVELSDDRHDGRQVGLVLDDDAGVAQWHVAGRAFVYGHVDDAINLLGSGHGAESRLVSLEASGRLEFAGLRFLAAERVGLAVLLAAGFVQALMEFAVLLFHLGQASDQATLLPLEGFLFLGQHGQASA